MKKLMLNNGLEAIVDDGDYDILQIHKWFAHPEGYAQTNIRQPHGMPQYELINGELVYHRRSALMHRLIIGDIKDGMHIDHINGNKLDNRRSNLEVVTPSENARRYHARQR